MDDTTDPTKQLGVEEDGLAAFIQNGLTKEALEVLDNDADPNTVNTEGQKVLCLAISCGNDVIVKRLLECGANISTEIPDGAGLQSTRTFKALITIPLIILQFYQPPGILQIFRFAILALPIELFIWSIVHNSHYPIQIVTLLRAIATVYFGLAVCSRVFGGILLKASVRCLESQSLLPYLARRLFLFLAFALVNPQGPDSIQHPPGIQATFALFEYQGDAEAMAMDLLNHGLVLGDPKEEYSLFRSFWTWSIGRGYARIGEFLLEKTSPRDLVLKRDPSDILVKCASKGHDAFLKLLLEKDTKAFEPKELSDALIGCLTGHIGSDKMVAIALLLLQYNADANVTSSEGRSALSWACETSVSHLLIQPFLDAGAAATIADVDSNGQTALHHAAWKHYFHSLEGLKALVGAGAPLNAIDRVGRTPLWEAVSKGCPSFVAFFLECGAEVDCRGEGGTTPLMEACRHSSEVNVAILLAAGADPNACTTDDTPLISACYRQYSEERDDMVSMLLEAGASPIMPLTFFRQPLVESVWCTRGSGEWMHEILGAAQAAGPVPHEILDSAIRQALSDESSFIYLDGLKTLIEAGGSPDTRPDPMYPGDGGAVIHYVCKSAVDFRGSTRDLIRFLVKRGASLSDRDRKRRTPLHVAVSAVNQTAVEELVFLNSPLDAVDDKRCTALTLACKTKPTESTGYTPLGHHPDLDGPEFSGERLQVFRDQIISDRLEQVKRSMAIEDITHHLREAGISPTLPDNDGLTPLHWACKAGNPITAGVILQNRHRFQTGVKSGDNYSMRDLVGARDNQGKTPLHWAAESGCIELVRMILAANSLLEFAISGGVTHDMDKKYPYHFAFVSELLHAVDDKDYTPLHYAAEEGHKGVIKVFLEEVDTLDISEVDKGVSVTSVAEARGHEEIAEMIKGSSVKVSSEEWKQYQRRASFNEGDWCGLECRWCAYQRRWMSA
ncbi:hypothetical protein GALMADRAFT_134040 [Galerina marginata CBS 339.88]|uniref:Uncharacterized protein n=1 Tax=Galerina marginata (strain CBS 339.88) TaxID=685588 RepID=A0A067TH13_GALM3|nr:hypothetical protein GALMADRAFT_134040 [Galerina marginata CBS 339.88]